jgi:phenylalanine-4-hydroxylase
MAEKTATEWLFEQLWNTDKDKFVWHSLLEQAKELEKQQIKDAFLDGKVNWLEKSDPMSKVTEIASEDYYQEKFNSK